VYLTAPSITSFKQLKGKKVAVSRFGSGSRLQTNLGLKAGGLDPEKDLSVLQIGNSGTRITAILSGVVDGTIMAADFVPKAKRGKFNVLAVLADTRKDIITSSRYGTSARTKTSGASPSGPLPLLAAKGGGKFAAIFCIAFQLCSGRIR
jgi:ABC-type nitrate/sulfonate/bicarbonate transport system substrate-binding protein